MLLGRTDTSSSEIIPGESTLQGINFTGGFPVPDDFAPSIVFLVLYAFTIPVLLWRLISPQHRTLLLFRPTMFLGARYASLVIRAVMSKRSYSINLLIAELVLISVGYLFLIEPLIGAWKRHVDAHSPPGRQPKWVNLVRWLLLLLLLVTIVLSVVAGSIVSNAFEHPDILKTIRGLREASYILSLVLTVAVLVVIGITAVMYQLPMVPTVYLAIPTACTVIVAAYRVAQSFSMDPRSASRSIAAFWVLQITIEFIAFLFFIAVSLPKWYPRHKAEPRRRSDAEAALAGTSGVEDSTGNVNGEKNAGTSGGGLTKRPWWAKGLVTRHLFKDKYYD